MKNVTRNEISANLPALLTNPAMMPKDGGARPDALGRILQNLEARGVGPDKMHQLKNSIAVITQTAMPQNTIAKMINSMLDGGERAGQSLYSTLQQIQAALDKMIAATQSASTQSPATPGSGVVAGQMAELRAPGQKAPGKKEAKPGGGDPGKAPKGPQQSAPQPKAGGGAPAQAAPGGTQQGSGPDPLEGVRADLEALGGGDKRSQRKIKKLETLARTAAKIGVPQEELAQKLKLALDNGKEEGLEPKRIMKRLKETIVDSIKKVKMERRQQKGGGKGGGIPQQKGGKGGGAPQQKAPPSGGAPQQKPQTQT